MSDKRKEKGLGMKYFVLNPNKADAYGDASRCAMMAYADAIQEENSTLAEELRGWVTDLDFNIALNKGRAEQRS